MATTPQSLFLCICLIVHTFSTLPSGSWSTAKLRVARGGLAATSVPMSSDSFYILFGGGYYIRNGIEGVNSPDVDIFISDSIGRLTWRMNSNLSVGRFNLVATTLGTKAIFAGK